LSVLWGQPVRVDNKPGASGILAFAESRLVPADGHTLFVADTATLAVNPLLHANLPYDPARPGAAEPAVPGDLCAVGGWHQPLHPNGGLAAGGASAA
jgi:hypothetical protein